MSGAGAVGAAFDAAVYIDGTADGDALALRKAVAAADYFDRELQVARDAVERAETKAAKFKAHADEAEAAIDAAKAEATTAAGRLAAARRQLQELKG